MVSRKTLRRGSPIPTGASRRKAATKLQTTLATVARAGVRASLIISSPLVRAVQSAEILAGELEYNGEFLRSAALAPEARVSEVWSEIRTHKDESNLWLASHNPLCSQLAGYLLGVPGLSVQFGKGTILCVEFDRFGPEPGECFAGC